jgi:hypothetical protein
MRLTPGLVTPRSIPQLLLDAYPHITAGDIRAALAYAADAVSHEEIVLTGPPDAPGEEASTDGGPRTGV